MTFIDKVLIGEEFPEEIDAYIEQWHTSKSTAELHEFLGFSWDEYALWVEQPQSLGGILFARQSGIPASKLDWQEMHLLAARSQSQQDPVTLKAWLKAKGLL